MAATQTARAKPKDRRGGTQALVNVVLKAAWAAAASNEAFACAISAHARNPRVTSLTTSTGASALDELQTAASATATAAALAFKHWQIAQAAPPTTASLPSGVGSSKKTKRRKQQRDRRQKAASKDRGTFSSPPDQRGATDGTGAKLQSQPSHSASLGAGREGSAGPPDAARQEDFMEQDREDRPKTSKPTGFHLPVARGRSAESLGYNLQRASLELAQDGCRDVQPRPPPLARLDGCLCGALGT